MISQREEGRSDEDSQPGEDQRSALSRADALKLTRAHKINSEHGNDGPYSQDNKQQPQLTFCHHIAGNYNTGRVLKQFEHLHRSTYNTVRSIIMLVRLSATTRQQPTLIREEPITRRRILRLAWLLSILSVLFMGWVLWCYGVAADAILRGPAWFVDLLGLMTAAGLLTLIILWGVVLWQRERLRDGGEFQGMSVDELYALSPKAFEHYVAELFERRGYKVEVRGRAGDLGVDLMLARNDGRRAVVQCKRYRHSVGPEVVRELLGTMLHERAVHGFLVTTAEISDGARSWAADKPITLIDGAALAQLGATASNR